MKHLSVHQLDDQIRQYVNGQRFDRIPQGWIRSSRTAIGMTLKQLASRLGFSVPAAKNFEMREVDEAITLASLRKIANAMEMDLVYYFKPKQDSLDDLLQIRAELKAKELMERSNQAMILENQEADNKNKSREYDRLITEIRNQKLSSLWD
jgi:predicted DNA-binding mobile mystery protein A